MANIELFLSCEHGGNQIPGRYEPLFADAGEVLGTHRGFDLGALPLFRLCEKELGPAFSIYSETCRLLVDLNRSLHRRSLFSEWTKKLSKEEKQQILEMHYHPYRQAFKQALDRCVARGNRVLHLSVHSFTPVLNGVVRNTDIGILYHPGRPWEKIFAARWKQTLKHHLPGMKVRYNYPYLGKPDGHVAIHRKAYPDPVYAGIELELCHKFAFDQTVYRGIVDSLEELKREGY
ncbi:MAG: N-formylglutamate amidohydrolase [Breznakibacter sp.]